MLRVSSIRAKVGSTNNIKSNSNGMVHEKHEKHERKNNTLEVGWDAIVGRNNIAPNVINRRRRRNTLRYYALQLHPSHRANSVVEFLVACTFDGGLDCAMRKPTLQQKTHLPGAFVGVGRLMIKFF